MAKHRDSRSTGPLVVALGLAISCGGDSRAPTAPTAPATAVESGVPGVLTGPTRVIGPVPGEIGPSAIAFPPRNEPFDFRQQLESKYRDQLRRGSAQSFVDLEGDIVWTQEYLRYRLNGCGHSEAVARVLLQIDTGVIQPTCGTSTTSSTVAFPPRNEPFAFRQELESKYRDGLRRSATPTFVDLEGDIVWTQEYIRYRVNNCTHAEAVLKVFLQIDGRGIQPTCVAQSPVPAPSPSPTPSPTPSPSPVNGICQANTIPSNAVCIGNGSPPVTAVCGDGAYSCSQSASGTCSSHGGVKCFVCPGALCS
ncbi:MAG: DUF3761 domain-containing protein [Vicinamibacterales bacterium]